MTAQCLKALRRPTLGATASLALSSLALAQTDINVNLSQAPRTQQILPGTPTTVWSYSGSIVSGAADSLTPIPNSFLGPILQGWQGQNVTIHWTNLLADPSVTHWHGMDVPANMDGHPSMPVASGDSRTIAFPILNRAGTYWYHPHPDMTTVEQVQMGLAGLFIVHDPEEAALNLPSGAYDLPICIQDRSFDANNQFVYNPNMVSGFFGSTFLVNGWANYTHETASRVHRLRLLNGSTSRIYKLAFSDGTPMVVIGNDGGLLAAPETKPYLILSPGERAEVWADFRNKTLGTQIILQSLPFSGGGGNQGLALDIMRFSITQEVTEERVLPTTLSSITPYQLQDATNANNPKVYNIDALPGGGMPNFVINGGLYSMTEVAPNEIAQCGTLEVIQVTNTMGPIQIPHPIHFHGRQFQIVSRTVTATGLDSWNTVKDGYNDSGWKDTFLIMPGETVTLLVQHGNYPGLFVYHCHNLVHEDMGMMRNFRLDAPPTCPADLDNGSGMGMPDNAVTIDDLLFFLVAFEAGDTAADLDDGSGTGTHDSAVTIDDLLFFLTHFEQGC